MSSRRTSGTARRSSRTSSGRTSALVAVVLLLAASCGGNDRAPLAAPAAPTTTATATPACALAPIPAGGEVTFTLGAKLFGKAPREDGEQRCLSSDAKGEPQWNGTGEKVYFDDTLTLSKPKGISVLRIDGDGRLFKRPTDGVKWTEISFLARHERVLYHPQGRHIVSAGVDDQDRYGIFLATNEGQGRRLIVQGEGAIGDMQWTVSGALVFTATHDGSAHLHRLVFPGLELTTVAETTAPIGAVAPSRFEGGGLAWSEGGCTLRVNRSGEIVKVPALIAMTTPIGWLPDGVLITQQQGSCLGAAPGPVYAFRPADGTVDLLTDRADAVAVRAELPAGPEFQLPSGIESDAPV